MSAWTVIGHTELGSAQAGIAFSSIPATYTDLAILLSARNSGNEGQLRILLNDSSSNFTVTFLRGSGSAAASFSDTIGFPGHIVRSVDTASTFTNALIYIPNYASNNSKSISFDGVTEHNNTASFMNISSMVWSNSAAITKVELTSAANNYAQYSSMTLYGITKGSSGGVSVS